MRTDALANLAEVDVGTNARDEDGAARAADEKDNGPLQSPEHKTQKNGHGGFLPLEQCQNCFVHFNLSHFVFESRIGIFTSLKKSPFEMT